MVFIHLSFTVYYCYNLSSTNIIILSGKTFFVVNDSNFLASHFYGVCIFFFNKHGIIMFTI